MWVTSKSLKKVARVTILQKLLKNFQGKYQIQTKINKSYYSTTVAALSLCFQENLYVNGYLENLCVSST